MREAILEKLERIETSGGIREAAAIGEGKEVEA